MDEALGNDSSQLSLEALVERKEPSQMSGEGKLMDGIIQKIGFRAVKDGRLFLRGKPLRGVTWPQQRGLQISLIKKLLVHYSTCIKILKRSYSLNQKCVMKKENQFHKLLKKRLITLRFKYII